MALTYWGWEGDQRDTAPYLKPNTRDKNVMPYEMVDYVAANTGLKALVRSGGDLDTLRRLLAGGFPVIVEKGLYISSEGWMGHYQVVSGYEDEKSRFIAQDSYTGPGKNVRVPYADMENFWQDFNNIFVVIYPAEREGEVLTLLGPLADEAAAFSIAAARASDQTLTLEGRDLFFAWYDRGTSLAALQDYAGAAVAFDEAFTIYSSLTEKERPWRNIWYQTGPYFAYYYTGRYYDVIDLADKTLQFLSSEPTLEESWVWRARAKAALGDTAGAVYDLRRSLEYHPYFAPSLYELQALGATVE
jgi:tetratricopeptide (TPR) repeat protein